METGRGAQAAAEFERIAVAPSSSDEVRREALWKAAELYETGGVVASEKRVLESIVQRYPDPILDDSGTNFLTQLTNPRTSYGRTFKIVSFRWLSANEI